MRYPKQPRVARRPSGWKGYSYEHSLARRGIRTKLGGQKLDPLFYAQKREEQVPFADIMYMIGKGDTVQQMAEKHPDADPEDLRRRGIKAIEAREGRDALSILDRQGVDESMRLAKTNSQFKGDLLRTLEDRQKCSFMHPDKVKLLKEQARDL